MKLSSKIQFADERIKEMFEDIESSNKILHKHITKALNQIKENSFSGIQIPKKLIPHEYLIKYGLQNLWKYNLPNAWRLIYSIESDGIVVISIILEWLNHKNYERKFRY